ncbi:MAG: CHAT domain-containing tetratricopeptide repeat protein [Bacteroidota bacterium]
MKVRFLYRYLVILLLISWITGNSQPTSETVRQEIAQQLQQFRLCPTNFFISSCHTNWEQLLPTAHTHIAADDSIWADLYLQTGKWIGGMDKNRWSEAMEYFDKGIKIARQGPNQAMQFELEWQQCNTYLRMNDAGRSLTCYDQMSQDSRLSLLQQQAVLIGKINALPIRDRKALIEEWMQLTSSLPDSVRISGKQLGNMTGTIGIKRLRLRLESTALSQPKKRLQIADELYQQAEAFYGPAHPEMAIYLLQKAQALRMNNDLLRAIEVGQQAFDLLNSTVPTQPLGYYAKIARLLGNCYDQLGDLHSARQQFQEAAERSLAYEGLHHIETAANLFNVGHVLFRLGDFESSHAYFLQAKHAFEGKLGPKHPFVGRCYQNLAAVSEKMAQDSLHLAYLKQSLDIHRLHAPASPAYAMTLSNIGMALQNQNRRKEAQKALIEAQKLMQEHLNAPYAHFIVLKNLGQFYEKEEAHQDAIQLYQQALEFSSGQAAPSPAERSALWMQMAGVYQQMKQWNQAVNASEQALLSLKIHNSVQTCLASDIQEKVFPVELPLSLGQLGKSLLHRYHQRHRAEDLSLARQVFLRSFICLDILQQNWESADSYRILHAQFHQLFESAIEAEYLAYQETKDSSACWQALIYSEQSRASRLRQAWKKQHAQSVVGERINQQLQFLMAKIAYLTAQLKTEKTELSTPVTQSWQEQIFLSNRTKDSLLREVAKANPAYHELMFQRFPTNAVDLLPDQSSSEAYIEFFWGKQSTYRFFVHQGNISFSSLGQRDSLEQILARLEDWWTDDRLIETQARNSKVLRSFATNSHSAYVLLMDSLRFPHRVCIVPDGPLHQFPMGLLLPSLQEDSVGSYSELSYFLKHHLISFRYSLNGRPQHLSSSARIVGFAPEEKSEQEIWTLRNGARQPLPYSIEEVQTLKQLFGADIFLGSAATEAAFIQNSSSSDILHLAMHAENNPEDPMNSNLWFHPTEEHVPLEGALHIHEITQTSLSRQMVVLSGCGTGSGQWEKGEGVISLSWAFQHAGAASVLASFWPVNDRSTAKIMTIFYQQLKEGVSKDAALQQAQLELIHSGEFNHPFYWAAWHISGDSAPLTFRRDFSNLIWIGLLLMLASGLIIWSMRPRKAKLRSK